MNQNSPKQRDYKQITSNISAKLINLNVYSKTEAYQSKFAETDRLYTNNKQ